jgi:hypothetical protein
VKRINAVEATNITKSTQCSESSVGDEVNRNFVLVVHSGSRKTKKPLISLTRRNRQCLTPSKRFTPLFNIQDSAVLNSSDTLHKLGVHSKDFDIPDIGNNAENTDLVNVKAAVVLLHTYMKPGISDGVVPKGFLGIHYTHNNINIPGKWLSFNMCSPLPRFTVILLHRIYIFTN